MGLYVFKHTVAMYVVFVISWLCCYAEIKLFQSDGRVTGVTDVKIVRSVLECSILFKNNENSMSFNYKGESKLCELSDNYPENYTIPADGWKVYSQIVDGAWTHWMNWDPCTVTCGVGTRTRTRSCMNPAPRNGGALCPDQSIENEICNEQTCIPGTYVSNYFISANKVTWNEAKMICEEMAGRLVIIDDQIEQDFLESAVTGFQHWIGLQCSSGKDCVWLDGSPLENGFINWGPGVPNNRDCVWVGYDVNKWDDDFCSVPRAFICEF